MQLETMEQYRKLILEDPETKNTYELLVTEENYKRAHEDMHFASALLNSAINEDLENLTNSASNTENLSNSALNTEESYSEHIEKHIWQYAETISLIQSMQNHYDDLGHPKKRKHVFSNIVNDLTSQGIILSAVQCQIKWKSLLRSYSTAKDNKNKTGRGPSRFQFFEEMDAILGTKPSNKCEHVLESCIDKPENQPGPSTGTDFNQQNVITEANTEDIERNEHVESETRYEKEKACKKSKRRRSYEDYLKEKCNIQENKNKRHAERMDLEKAKMEIELQKIAIFKEYLNKKK